MDTGLIIYLSGFVVSFIIGLYLTFTSSTTYKEFFQGLFYGLVESLFSWLFVIFIAIKEMQPFVNKHLNKKLPWKKGKE